MKLYQEQQQNNLDGNGDDSNMMLMIRNNFWEFEINLIPIEEKNFFLKIVCKKLRVLIVYHAGMFGITIIAMHLALT